MQKNTLDNLLKSTAVEGSETKLEDIKSLQSPPQIGSDALLDNYDESITDIDFDQSHDKSSGIEPDTNIFPSIFGNNSSDVNANTSTCSTPVISSSGPATKNVPTNLLNLLNGNRKPTKSESLEDPEESLKPVSDLYSANYADEKTLQLIEKENRIGELEKKVFNSGHKSVNLKDYLSWSKPKQTAETIVLNSEGDIEDISETSVASPDSRFDAKAIELKLHQNHKKVSAKDLLGVSKTITPKKQYMVTLKVDKASLQFYKKFENPLKTRGNSQYVKSKQYSVCLKIAGDKLRPFETELDKIKPNNKVKNASSIFSSMMKNSAAGSVRLTKLQKLKDLEPPILKKHEFHIFEEEPFYSTIAVLPHLQKRQRTLISIDEHEPFKLILDNSPVEKYRYHQTFKILTRTEAVDRFVSMCHPNCSLFNHLHQKLFEVQKPSLVLWPQLFEPLKTESLFILSENQIKLRNWLFDAFAKLKNESFKGPRKLKKRPKMKKDDRLQDFIVDDFFGIDNNLDEEVFLPIMIVEGQTGSGKTASIYTAMKEMGGYVYEINSSQTRSRRDLLSTLKELCTTHLIHKKDEDGDFQKGIILLEDCDILFEQDRTFWAVVLEILEISRRPIALTCTDLSVIPTLIRESALDNDGMFDLNHNRPNDIQQYKRYMWGCCYTQGYDLTDSALDSLLQIDQINESIYNNLDIRKHLLLCQMICQSYSPPKFTEDSIHLTIVDSSCAQTSPQLNNSLNDISQNMDLLSVADVLESNVPSQLNHDEIKNEFIDIYYIDETTKLKQTMLPYELKLTDYIYDRVSQSQPDARIPDPNYNMLHNKIRTYINDFVGSRSKPIPAFLQGLQFQREGPRMTRSNIENDKYEFWNPEPTGINDNSMLNYLSATPYILDVTPFVRNWCGFQMALDRYDKQIALRTKAFLQWREFQNKSNKVLRTITTRRN